MHSSIPMEAVVLDPAIATLAVLALPWADDVEGATGLIHHLKAKGRAGAINFNGTGGHHAGHLAITPASNVATGRDGTTRLRDVHTVAALSPV